MAQDLESKVGDSSCLSPKELIAYKGYLLKLYFASLGQLHISPEEAEFYHRTLDSLSLPQRLNLLEYLKKNLASLNSLPLVGYFRQNYIEINSGRDSTIQENRAFSHNRVLTLVKRKE
ncbi:hypothetical protein HYX04_04585 [Candidatus Woesearchaeota archaeon]|nr:hypothetical protein [Candidatus Woesearchaeota archaeon]